jgi:hypothetical protein
VPPAAPSAPGQPPAPPKPLAGLTQEQARQLRQRLEAARARVDAELRAVQGQRLQGLTEEQRREVETALAQARTQAAQALQRAQGADLKKLEETIKVQGTFRPLVVSPLPPSSPADLDIDNATVADAARQVLDRTKLKAELQVDPDVPADARVTLRARNVKANTALDLLAQSAGVNWSLEQKDGKTILRLGKTVRTSPYAQFFHGFSAVGPRGGAGGIVVPPVAPLAAARDWIISTRSTFTCPHCKGRATVIRQNAAPKCPKCTRLFQPDWQFCPQDGSKRPAPANEWKFCPMCGKRVDPEKSEGDTLLERPMVWDMEEYDEAVPVLGQVPFLGNLFRVKPAAPPPGVPVLEEIPVLDRLFRFQVEPPAEPCLELEQ